MEMVGNPNEFGAVVTPNHRRSQSAAVGTHVPPAAPTTRSVVVTLTESGDLVWSVQDVGSDVGVLRPGATEYEWWRTVRAAYVSKLFAALGGEPGDDVVSLVAARFKSDVEFAEFATSHGIPTEFDSWISTSYDD